MTTYLILKANDDEQHWEVDAIRVNASSARRALSVAEVGAGTYVAIPDRSWKPLTVKVEQTTKVTIA